MRRLCAAAARLFCIASGLILAPTLLALGLAAAMGLLPSFDRIRRALADSTVNEKAEQAERERVLARDERAVPQDLPLWRQRLLKVGEAITRDRENFEAALQSLRAERQQLDELRSETASLLGAMLGRPIDGQEMKESSSELIAELQRQQREAERLPDLLATLSGMDPESLAGIFAVRDPQKYDDVQAARLLRGLPRRKSGQVLEELGRSNPDRARQLIQLMGEPGVAGGS